MTTSAVIEQRSGEYHPVGDELDMVIGAWRAQLPVLLKGPTGVRQDQAGRASRGPSRPALAPDFFGRLRPLPALRDGVRGGSPASGDQDGSAEPRRRPDDDDDKGEESAFLKALANPFTGENAIGRMFRSMLGRSSVPSDDEPGPEGSGPSAAGVSTMVPPGRRRGTPVAGGAPATLLAPGGGTARYPEWDQRAGRYRADWVTVHEADPWLPDGERDLAGLRLAPRPVIKQGLVRAALAPETRGRAGQGEQPHPDGVVDLAQWLHQQRHGRPAGSPPLPFADVRRTRPDVAVLVLLDASASTGDDTGNGESVFDQHLGVAYRLAAGCESVGLPLFAFQAWGRGLVRVLRVKSFAERIGGRTRARLAHEGAHATADTRQAIWEARRLGIGCVCVGVTSPSEEQLRSQADALAAASALHLGDTTEIEARLGGLIRRALRDARRRSDHDGLTPAG